MSKIHPDHQHHHQKRCLSTLENVHEELDHHQISSISHSDYALTVWKRSSMSFQGTDGFTVFDCSGRLAFRVDNYTRKDWRTGGGLVLMDGSGKPLLTLKPQLQALSMQYEWHGYRGEGYGKTSYKCREFTMKRQPTSFIYNTKRGRESCEAQVFMGGLNKRKESRTPDFKVEGSFRRRNCKIVKCHSTGDMVVAKIARKRVINTTVVLTDDVFSLVVKPDFDPELIMAFVVILDRICPKTLVPVLCS